MTIDPDSYLFVHHQRQRELERRRELVLAVRNAPDDAEAVPGTTTHLPVSKRLLGSRRRRSLRRPRAAGGSPGRVAGL